MLKNYSPHLVKYQELWAKYGQRPTPVKSFLAIPCKTTLAIISSQEDSIKWSLKLMAAIDTLATEQKKESSELITAFSEGVLEAQGSQNKLYAGLAKIGDPEEIIERWELFFVFNSLEDLFLSDETDITSVMHIE